MSRALGCACIRRPGTSVARRLTERPKMRPQPVPRISSAKADPSPASEPDAMIGGRAHRLSRTFALRFAVD